MHVWSPDSRLPPLSLAVSQSSMTSGHTGAPLWDILDGSVVGGNTNLSTFVPYAEEMQVDGRYTSASLTEWP